MGVHRAFAQEQRLSGLRIGASRGHLLGDLLLADAEFRGLVSGSRVNLTFSKSGIRVKLETFNTVSRFSRSAFRRAVIVKTLYPTMFRIIVSRSVF